MNLILALVILPSLWLICVGESAPAPWNSSGFTGELRALYRGQRWFFRLMYALLGSGLLMLLVVF